MRRVVCSLDALVFQIDLKTFCCTADTALTHCRKHTVRYNPFCLYIWAVDLLVHVMWTRRNKAYGSSRILLNSEVDDSTHGFTP